MKIKLITSIFLILVLFISCTFKQPIYTIQTFEIENGWGYSIFEKEKLIIKQQYIPSISEQKHFKTKKEAVVIGSLVIEKLKSCKTPSITLEELQNNISL